MTAEVLKSALCVGDVLEPRSREYGPAAIPPVGNREAQKDEAQGGAIVRGQKVEESGDAQVRDRQCALEVQHRFEVQVLDNVLLAVMPYLVEEEAAQLPLEEALKAPLPE